LSSPAFAPEISLICETTNVISAKGDCHYLGFDPKALPG
jgi:hypothetical protein